MIAEVLLPGRVVIGARMEGSRRGPEQGVIEALAAETVTDPAVVLAGRVEFAVGVA